MALNASKLRFPKLGSDFIPNDMEIGTASSVSFAN